MCTYKKSLCMYVHMSVYVCAYECAYVYACVYIHIVCTYVCVHMNVYTYSYVSVRIPRESVYTHTPLTHRHSHTLIHTHILSITHSHTHTHTHTHTRTHTGSALLSLQNIYLKRAAKIIKDSTHPGNHLLILLPSGKRFRSMMAKTERLRRSFFSQAIRLFNTNPVS